MFKFLELINKNIKLKLKMKLEIDNLINKYKRTSKSCIVVGSGPTMNDFDYKNFEGK